MLLQACLNGTRERGEHPALPLDPGALAADAARVVGAGAGSLHVHPRDRRGEEALEARVIGAAVAAVREAVGGVELSVSTGLWMTRGDVARRHALVATWEERPDCASVNVAEEGWRELCELLGEHGVRVEIGLWSVEDAEAFAASDLAPLCVRALVEPKEDDGPGAVAVAADVDAVLDAAGLDLPRLHHGHGPATWSVLDAAVRLGRDVRIGLEDTLTLPDGRRAASNLELVVAASTR